MISKLEHPLEMLSTEEISLAYEIYKTSEDYDEACLLYTSPSPRDRQ